MAVRMVKLVLVAAFYVGRIDTPLFAPGVGQVGPIHIDGHPLQYRKDLVLHDAHRHRKLFDKSCIALVGGHDSVLTSCLCYTNSLHGTSWCDLHAEIEIR